MVTFADNSSEMIGRILIFFLTLLCMILGQPAQARQGPNSRFTDFKVKDEIQLNHFKKTSVVKSKLDPRLLLLFETNASSNHGKVPSKIVSSNQFEWKGNQYIQVRIHVTSISDTVIDVLKQQGARIERVLPKFNRIQASLPINLLNEFQRLNFIEYIDLPSYGQVRFEKRTSDKLNKLKNEKSVFTKSEPQAAYQGVDTGVVTEGDAIQNSDIVKTELGYFGSGVKIGVISDGVYGIETSLSTGDIPEGDEKTCDPNQIFKTGVVCKSFNSTHGIDTNAYGEKASEGLALLEILYDVAPEAELYFSNFATSDDFISAVEWLSAPESEGGAGVDVIVDDIAFYQEPYFVDGDVAVAVKEAMRLGVHYVTAAGNDAHQHIQEDFTDYDDDGYHNFQGTRDKYDFFPITIYPQMDISLFLQWDDEFDHPTNDFDLYVYFFDASGNPYLNDAGIQEFVESSDNNISGTKKPLESLSFRWNGSQKIYGLVYIKAQDVTEAGVELELFTVPSQSYEDANEYLDTYDSVFGHAALNRVIGVGAVNLNDSGHDDVAYYSSWGPVAVNNTWHYKPDVISVDGVSVTGHGGFMREFYGTSAAAPHVAGCLALMLDKNHGLSVDAARDALLSTAHDIDEPDYYEDYFDSGYGFQAGYGLVDCYSAVTSIEEATEGTAEDDTENSITEDAVVSSPSQDEEESGLNENSDEEKDSVLIDKIDSSGVNSGDGSENSNDTPQEVRTSGGCSLVIS